MNVDFPGFGTVWMWWVIVGVMATVLAAVLGFFRWKRWI
jgi:Mg2+ and Co2+ transporter CorA